MHLYCRRKQVENVLGSIFLSASPPSGLEFLAILIVEKTIWFLIFSRFYFFLKLKNISKSDLIFWYLMYRFSRSIFNKSAPVYNTLHPHSDMRRDRQSFESEYCKSTCPILSKLVRYRRETIPRFHFYSNFPIFDFLQFRTANSAYVSKLYFFSKLLADARPHIATFTVFLFLNFSSFNSCA